ncbi:MAG: universal stress protein [Chloroflexi bacterium]|nr:universal stress protein [Chloroflexota bacterium]
MYKKILVPLDGSLLAECVIPHIKTIAKAANSRVELISVAEPIEIPTRGKIALSDDDLKQINTDAQKDLHNYLTSIRNRLKRSGIEARSVVLTGNPAEILVDYVGSNDIDLIIMATHGRSGITKWFWGSIAEKVLRAVNVPVLLIKTSSCEKD